MEIKVYVKEGYVAFECEGVFVEPVEKILLDQQSRTFKVYLEQSGREVELQYIIDDEMLEAIGNHDVCGLSYCHQGSMLGAAFIPFGRVN